MSIHKSIPVVMASALVASVAVGCGQGSETTDQTAADRGLPQGSEPVDLDPADFTTEIDNPYWPMTPGSKWVYRAVDTEGAEEKVVVEVTDETKTIANGVEARVVRDTASEGGRPIEVTDDWYAQDQAGNVWYLGEDTAEYENGKVSTTAGSFEAGVDGAQAGIAMPADPVPGLAYRQEYLAGVAEDRGAIVSLDEMVEVPAGQYTDVVMTRDLVPLEPKVEELKFYARGVGPALSLHLDGAGERESLVSYAPGK